MSIPRRSGDLRFFHKWLVLSIALLVLGSLMAYQQLRERQRIDRRERERLATQAEIIEKNITPQLLLANRIFEGMLQNLPAWQAENNGFQSADRQLRIINNSLIGIRPILIIKADGTTIASSDEKLVGKNFAYRDYFQTALKNPDPGILHVSTPFVTVLDSYVISLYRAIPGPNGEFAGIVIAGVVPGYFSTLLDSVRYAADVRSSITVGEGSVFLISPKIPGIDGMNLAKAGSLLTRHLDSHQPASLYTGRIYQTGEMCMVALRTIQLNAPPMDRPLVIAVSRDLDLVFADWLRRCYQQAVLFAGICLFGTLGLLLLQKRRREQIAERSQAEKSLRESDNLLREMAGKLDQVFFKANRDYSRFHYISPAADRIWGRPRSLLMENPGLWLDWLHPEDRDAVERFVGEHRSEESYSYEFRIARPDGEIRWIHAHAFLLDQPAGGDQVIGYQSDITERKRTEERAQLAQQIFDTARQAIFVSDRQGNLLDVNAEACRLAKYCRAEILRLRKVDILTQKEVPRIGPEPAQRDAGEAVEKRWLLLCADGSTVPLDLVLQPLPGDRYLAIGRDLTERDRVFRRLAAALHDAEVASRAKSQFLAAASHDLRQPIMAINLFRDALSKTELSEVQKTINQYLAQSTQSLSDILNTLLDISRLDSGVVIAAPKVIWTETLLRSIDAEYGPLALAKSLRFKLFFPSRELAIVADSRLLRRLLGNLVGNAIKYTSRGGVLVAIRRRGAEALLQVWDTGIGIAPEHMDSIFEEYVQIGNAERDRTKGLGLGLAIVKRLAKLLNTEVVCRSRIGTGTVFEFTVPISTQPLVETGRRANATAEPPVRVNTEAD